jgi:hypothetical protein
MAKKRKPSTLSARMYQTKALMSTCQAVFRAKFSH